jgi:hypothetical protein
MAATVLLYDRIKATVSGLVWTCEEDKSVEGILNALTGLCKQDPDGASQGGGANPDYFCALWMTTHFPGKVTIAHFDEDDSPQSAKDGRQVIY